jgi:phospholipase C
MMENRSFDHLFGSLATDASYAARASVDGLVGGELNLDLDGRPVFSARLAGRGDGSVIPHHDWRSVRLTWNNGLNDNFVRANAGPKQAEVMSYLVRDQLPFHYALADHFTVCDRWFASFLGPTWPNRFYLHATTSGGRRENLPLGLDAPPTISERMALKCRTVKQYAAGPVLWSTVALPSESLSGNTPYRAGGIEDFFRDARMGMLPSLSVIDPDFKVSDGSPLRDIRLADAFVASIYRAMAESPQWSRSLTVFTYDEHGGYFDHVAPPQAIDPRPEFAQLGFRVPTVVVGPTAWEGRVVSTPYEHASVAATLATRFGIRTLGPRMDAARDLADCIDPARVALPRAAPVLPKVELPNVVQVNGALDVAGPAELERAIAGDDVPPELVDPRSSQERFGSWLRLAQELDAVKLVG